MTHNTQGGVAPLSEEYLKECLNRVYSADPTGYDVVIKDLNQRMNKLVKHIRKLQSPLPASPEGTEDWRNFPRHAQLEWISKLPKKYKSDAYYNEIIDRFNEILHDSIQPLQQENEQRGRQIESMTGTIMRLQADQQELKQENKELQEWKRQAIEVMPDMQEIGKLLNVPLGQSVHDKIIPRIESLKQKNEFKRNMIADLDSMNEQLRQANERLNDQLANLSTLNDGLHQSNDQLVQEMHILTKQEAWISVEDGLPAVGDEWYLCGCDGRIFLKMFQYTKHGWMAYDDPKTDDRVTHWKRIAPLSNNNVK